MSTNLATAPVRTPSGTAFKCPTCGAHVKAPIFMDNLLWSECPDHGEFSLPLPQQRRTDPLFDSDVRDKDELTGFEKFMRRVFIEQKKPWGQFIAAIGALVSITATTFPSKYLILAGTLLTAAGGWLMGGGSDIKSDNYEKLKSQLLERHGKM